VLVLAAFSPALEAGFVWDDDQYLTANPLIIAPDGLRRIWFSRDSPSQYFPLTYTSFRLEHALWGFDPRGYHLVNILLHLANALLLWRLLAVLAVPGAWLAAALFAVHPLQVESVAWVTERKNVLSTLFYLASLLLFVRQPAGERRWNSRWYLLSLATFLLALFAKTTAVTLPVALLVILWYRRESPDRTTLLLLAPFGGAALSMGLLTIWWERFHQGTRGSEFAFGPLERLLIAGRALWFYPRKLLAPLDLTFSYPKWQIDVRDPWQYFWPLLALGAILLLWWFRERIPRGLPASLLLYLAAISPMLGFVALYTFRYSFVADHYAYLALAGLLLPLTALHHRAAARLEGLPRRAVGLLIPLLLLSGLSLLTYRQAGVYRSAELLWRDTIAKNPSSWIARSNLGLLYLGKGMVREALQETARAVELYPGAPDAQANYGVALQQAGYLDQAILRYREALRLDPDFAVAKGNLGSALAMKGDGSGASALIGESMQSEALRANTYLKMGDFFAMMGKTREARSAYESVLMLQPDHVDAREKLRRLERP
jgi:tetratricopeptide (TPR) repeat protein